MDPYAFKEFRRSQIAELRPYVPGEDMTRISVSAPDTEAGSPKLGDMIARNPKNHADMWLVSAEYFADNFEPLPEDGNPAPDHAPLRGHKQTSERVSSIAGRYIDFRIAKLEDIYNGPAADRMQFCEDVRTLAASCMSQDETPKTPVPEITGTEFHRSENTDGE